MEDELGPRVRKRTSRGSGSPLFTELPRRRVLLGNWASGIHASRKVGYRHKTEAPGHLSRGLLKVFGCSYLTRRFQPPPPNLLPHWFVFRLRDRLERFSVPQSVRALILYNGHFR